MDRGATWLSDASGTVSLVTAIVFKPGDDDTVIVLDDGQNATLRSEDGGATWTTHTAGMPGSAGNSDQLSMVVIRLLPNTLYMGTAKGVFKSEDGGATWAAVPGEGLPSTRILTLTPHPTEPETVGGLVVVGDEVHFYRTNDAGATWYRPSENQTAKYRGQTVTVDMHDPSRLLMGGGNGVFSSVDAAYTWVDLNTGLEPDVTAESRTVQAIAFDPVLTGVYYAATEGVLQIYSGLIGMDLVVSATPAPTQVEADGVSSIEFAVANVTGEAATDVVFEFVAPETFQLENWANSAGTFIQNGNTVDCTIANIRPGEPFTGSVDARAIGDEGAHEFTVTAMPAQRETTSDNNTIVFGIRIGVTPPEEDETPTPTPVNEQPWAPSGSSGDGGSGGWLWLAGLAAALLTPLQKVRSNRL